MENYFNLDLQYAMQEYADNLVDDYTPKEIAYLKREAHQKEVAQQRQAYAEYIAQMQLYENIRKEGE